MEPVVYTKNGNVLASTLVYSTEWEDHIEHEVTLSFKDEQLVPHVTKHGYLLFKERYHDAETGELVKESLHAYQFKGLDISPTAEQIG